MNYSSLTTSLEGNWWVLKIKDKGKRIKVGGAVEPEVFRNNLQVNIRYLCGR
jgi:hypothetical protein